MDSLEEHLAQLRIINKKSLTSKSPSIEIGSLPNSPYATTTKTNDAALITHIKDKSPSKKITNSVCQSEQHRKQQQCSSIGSVGAGVSGNVINTTKSNNNPNKNLFYNDDQNVTKEAQKLNETTSRIGKMPILLRKQPAYEQQHHVYSNIKMTLDNPAILDQQLEALEHHKKQLEKRGLLTSANKLPTIGPKLSSASYINGELVAAARSSPSVKMMAAKIIENQQKHQQQENQIKLIKTQSNEQNKLFNNNKNINNDIDNKILENENLMIQKKFKNHTSLQSDQQQQNDQDIVYSNIMHSSNPLGKYNVHGEKNIYTNIQYNPDLPPPPIKTSNDNGRPSISNLSTPSEMSSGLEYYNQQQQNSSISGIEEEFPLPPSPVSSSYSELRRATDNCPQISAYPTVGYQSDLDSITQSKQNSYMNTTYNDYSTYGGPSTQSFSQSSSASDYYGFGSICQGSSTYESIYEPITINPTNQMASRSNFSLYTSYENDAQNVSNNSIRNVTENINLTNSNNSNKEIEVQNFTDLIVNSIDSTNDSDSYGSCVKCGERVVGENSGCTAMDQIYHISCFTCSQCQINLQGKPFYALENKPYCEEDYLNTLEKCSVCMKPILERILRATGKPYHPQCFTCVVCGNSLDGIPFTVDATNQNYCIQDFHKKFAPRCCVCREPIMPDPGQEETVRVVALDRSFHFECYKCEDCGLLLSSEAEGRGCYPLDDHVLCKSCNAKRVQALTNHIATEL
ncbi:paxillin-B-like isoform X2 [Condylostylus longicornis]|uniref:paxillin-B-like isoform X2 n=1 Tax=Condylostylus longicornis TaxID=2530218 RepID=UPI00244DEF00|nr:paxillin-B-like isoform X2 [Condylostylus longicornis]